MRKIKNFQDFNAFASHPDLLSVYLFANSDSFSFSHVDHAVKAAASMLFDFITPPGIFDSVRKGVPVYNYGNHDEISQMISDGVISRKDVYNKPGNLKNANDKVIFHKKMQSRNFVPKTAFNATDAAKLKFPIIAKPATGSKGQGIEVFKDASELKNSKSKFGVFCEKFDLVREFRVITVKGDPVYFAERIPVNKKAKSLRESEDIFMRSGTIDGRSEYIWRERKFTDELSEEKIKKLCLATHEDLSLEVLGVDIGLDSKGKFWVIEANTCPGLNNDQVVKIYLSIFEDYYGRCPEKYSMDKIKDIQKELRARNKDKIKFSFHSKPGRMMDHGYKEDPDKKTTSAKFDIEKSFGTPLKNLHESLESDAVGYEIGDYLYHVTLTSNLPKIKRQGLIPKDGVAINGKPFKNRLYFATSLIAAYDLVRFRGDSNSRTKVLQTWT
jgi:hypothetical protein